MFVVLRLLLLLPLLLAFVIAPADNGDQPQQRRQQLEQAARSVSARPRARFDCVFTSEQAMSARDRFVALNADEQRVGSSRLASHFAIITFKGSCCCKKMRELLLRSNERAHFEGDVFASETTKCRNLHRVKPQKTTKYTFNACCRQQQIDAMQVFIAKIPNATRSCFTFL